MPARRRSPPAKPVSDPERGLFRTTYAGPGHTLNEAFANIERAGDIERITRHPDRNLFGARVYLKPEEGNGYWDFIRIREEIFVIIMNFAYKDPRFEMLSGDDLVQFYFKLSGDLTMAIGRSQSLRIAQPSLLIYRQPSGIEVEEWTAPSSLEKAVAVNVQPQALLRLLARDPSSIPPALKAVVEPGDASQIRFSQIPLSAEMFDLATKVVDNPHQGPLGLVYAESLVMLLICAAVISATSLSDSPAEQYTPREIRCLNTARRLLMNELERPPTIRQVARAAGMNETTLKRGFKSLFGETLFDFSVRCRMQRALTLLREQRLPVAEVGAAVGYRHQTSFATAFRRHFGMRPKDVRRTRDG